MLKIWLTNQTVRGRFSIMKVEIEIDDKRMDTGSTPDGVVSGKVKHLDSGMAIMHLFNRGTD